jgi:muramidase (phage lysozyme)
MTQYGELLAQRSKLSNVRAFLSMISISEGTANYDNPYAVIVGSTLQHPDLFTDFSDHPRKLVHLNATLSSDAAGRYQIMSKTFDGSKEQLQLPDFSPESQDIIALLLFSQSNALADVEAGRVYTAISKCAHIWASLPGAGYNQHENSLDSLISAYMAKGGDVTDNMA